MAKTRTIELFLNNSAAAFLIQDKSEVRGMRETDTVALSVQWPAATSAGTVILEKAPTEDYAGTWISLGSLAVGGNAGTAQQTANLAMLGEFVRARWSVAPVDNATKPRVFLHYTVS